MPPPIPPFDLEGRSVRLEALDRRHVPALTAAAGGDRSTYDFTIVPDGEATTARYVDDLLSDRDAGLVIPFAQCRRDGATTTAVGCTRFMNLRRWRGRTEPDEVEIGGTWLASDHQRSSINTEAKLLLLTHAFETWGVWRVEFATDARNWRSRDAIERIGATFEGVLRNHRVAADRGALSPRDTAVFSITDAEWPSVGARLRERVRR